jgi:hypothetical protein
MNIRASVDELLVNKSKHDIFIFEDLSSFLRI